MIRKISAAIPGITLAYINVAEGGVFHAPTAVRTVLGSCVSVTFFSRRRNIGAIFHSLMPSYSLSLDRHSPNPSPYRFVDTAIDKCVEDLLRLGIRSDELECKVFGGASAMMPGEISVGPKNVRMALEVLEARRLRVTATHVGGSQGRKLIFVSSTGEVFVKFITKTIGG